ncbi:nitrite/sulfite reductase [Hydrogenimonas urashimensis]|uniref:nitrite/sulfite reductase n=1 Tax=Hydrogenimonas urashimensis TaxID=2740515 RepID=UPI0019159965|nr:nitrite/sulfite reductase [Hydrogenimonas urashimensis]
MEQKKLNKIEKLKRQLKPVEFYEKLTELDPTHLDESDRFYLKNFGIFNHKLAPETFTLRIRVPAGRIGVESFERIYRMARSADAKMIVTSRAQLELHGLDYHSALEAARKIEDFGMTAWQTFTDNFRNIVTDPLDGIAEDAVMEVYGLVLAMQESFLKKPEYVGMIPRKFNTAISGRLSQSLSFFGNDLYFALAKKDGVYGFNLYAGGKNSHTACPLDIFVTPAETVALFRTVAKIYKEEGPRESRSRARLFHMIESIGIETLRLKIAERYRGLLEGAGESLMKKGRQERRVRLKNGLYAHRYTTRFGETDAPQVEEILHICDRYGVDTVRIGCDQNFYIPDLPPDVPFDHSAPRYEGILACAGSRYCVYSLMDTKESSASLALERCRRLGISLGFSGCLKGCARHAFCDIGLVGIRTKLFADEVERGVRLYLGALYSGGERAGRLILYSVPMRALNAMIDLIAGLFEKSGYSDFEDFSKEVLDTYSEPALAFWLLLNYYRANVAKSGELLLLDKCGHEDEKGCFIEKLQRSGSESDRQIVEYLQCQEAFPFREAIIHLERECFRVKSQP